MNTRIRMAVLRLAAVALVLGAWLGTAGAEERLAVEQRLVLADADGKTVTLDDFAGKWLLVYFGYIHCAGPMPDRAQRHG